MRSSVMTVTLRSRSGLGLFIALLGTLGCTESGANKAWSSLSVCVYGPAAQAQPVERMKQLRLLSLAHPGTDGKADAWPGHCAQYANQLYAALESSGNQASLKRTMQSKLGCSQDKPSCVLNSETLAVLAGEMADGAKAAELKFEAVPGVKGPDATTNLRLTAADWKPVNADATGLVGPEMTRDGHVQWLLKTKGERARPLGCIYAAGSKALSCTPSSEKIPGLPSQSVQLVSDDEGLFVAGLTEKGLAGFDTKTGDPVAVKGVTGNLRRDGVAVEKGEGDKGWVAIPLTKGKAGKPIELKSKGTITQPFSMGNQILWLEPSDSGTTFVVKSLKGNRLVDTANLVGAFSGPFHWCKAGANAAVATWSGHQGQRSAKPNAGSDMTQVTVAFLKDGQWSKPIEAKIPFRRAIASDLVCAGNAASVAWAEPVEGGVKVGQLTCDPKGCKTAESTLANVDSRWWWSVGPVGERVLLMWRASLGEARMRVAPIEQLAQAPDVVLFDDPDHGGPKAGEATSVFTKDSALLFFKQEPPVVLNVGTDGSTQTLAAQ